MFWSTDRYFAPVAVGTMDVPVKVENSVRIREATRAVGASVEAHFFERGEHGFGLMKTAGLPVAIWPELLWNWLGGHRIV